MNVFEPAKPMINTMTNRRINESIRLLDSITRDHLSNQDCLKLELIKQKLNGILDENGYLAINIL